MKKLLLIIIILGIIALLFTWKGDTETNPTNIPGNEVRNENPDPSNATFIFDDEPITLLNGRSERPLAPGSALVEETAILGTIAYGDLNADDKEDAALLLLRSGGGSGSFIYVALFISGPITYKGTDAIFIGDRVSPQNISINNGIVTVKYLDREEDEAMAAEPTVSVSREFIYKDGSFEER